MTLEELVAVVRATRERAGEREPPESRQRAFAARGGVEHAHSRGIASMVVAGDPGAKRRVMRKMRPGGS